MKLSEALVKLNESKYEGKVKSILSSGKDEYAKMIELHKLVSQLYVQTKNKYGVTMQQIVESRDPCFVEKFDEVIFSSKFGFKKGEATKLFNEFFAPLERVYNDLTDLIFNDYMKTNNAIQTQLINDFELREAFRVWGEVYNAYKWICETTIDKGISSFVSVGMERKKAIDNISKMCDKVRYYNRRKKFPDGKFFDPMTPVEITNELEQFDNTLKLRGSMDLYIKFDDKKVTKIYW